MENELVPGVGIEKKESGLDEHELLRQEIAIQAAETHSRTESRKLGILTQVGMQLRKGTPVEITEEMRELGIVVEVAKLIQEAEYREKLEQFLRDDDDFDDMDDNTMSLGI